MRELTDDEVKCITLDILRNIANFCDEHDIRYYLCGGTLLGAIRHKGFIPWDDDIDIIMPRPDYIRFNSIYNQHNERYKVRSLYTEKDWDSTFATVEDSRTVRGYLGFSTTVERGINVDILPIDGAPENYFIRKLFWYTNNILTRIAILSVQKFKISHYYNNQPSKYVKVKKYIRTGIKFFAIPFAKTLKIFNFNRLVTKLASQFNVDTSTYIGVSTFPHYGYRECIKGAPFLKIKKRKFENEFFNTPDNYEEYLSNLYGDFMKLPPKKFQVTHHDFKSYWKGE